ncbi:MAG: LLM class flavin-dependent oxidoreductase [Micropruina sp.]
MALEFGVDTFGDVTRDPAGVPLPHAQVLRNVVAQAELADQLGLDFFMVGEHHRRDFAISAPEVLLAAIAGRTERIHLGTAVTVLSSDDPVRVFQRFATLDAVSSGRAEIILGRGSFTESFPLFGYDLADYEQLFEEKVALFALVREQEPVSWPGGLRAAIDNQSVYPHLEHGLLRTWSGVGGSPESVVWAAHYGFGLVLAIIGGSAQRFVPFADLYRRALAEFGRPELPIAFHSPGHLSDTDEEAQEEFYPHYAAMMTTIGRERGWPPMTRQRFEHELGPDGSLLVGAPQTVATKIANAVRALGASRVHFKFSNGSLPHESMLHSLELYATQVAPLVREQLGH